MDTAKAFVASRRYAKSGTDKMHDRDSNRREFSAWVLGAGSCAGSTNTTKQAFDAAPDVIATPKELLRDIMGLLSDPQLKSLILIRSPMDLMSRLRALEADSVRQTRHQSKQAAINPRQEVSGHVRKRTRRFGKLTGSS